MAAWKTAPMLVALATSACGHIDGNLARPSESASLSHAILQIKQSTFSKNPPGREKRLAPRFPLRRGDEGTTDPACAIMEADFDAKQKQDDLELVEGGLVELLEIEDDGVNKLKEKLIEAEGDLERRETVVQNVTERVKLNVEFVNYIDLLVEPLERAGSVNQMINETKHWAKQLAQQEQSGDDGTSDPDPGCTVREEVLQKRRNKLVKFLEKKMEEQEVENIIDIKKMKMEKISDAELELQKVQGQVQLRRDHLQDLKDYIIKHLAKILKDENLENIMKLKVKIKTARERVVKAQIKMADLERKWWNATLIGGTEAKLSLSPSE